MTHRILNSPPAHVQAAALSILSSLSNARLKTIPLSEALTTLKIDALQLLEVELQAPKVTVEKDLQDALDTVVQAARQCSDPLAPLRALAVSLVLRDSAPRHAGLCAWSCITLVARAQNYDVDIYRLGIRRADLESRNSDLSPLSAEGDTLLQELIRIGQSLSDRQDGQDGLCRFIPLPLLVLIPVNEEAQHGLESLIAYAAVCHIPITALNAYLETDEYEENPSDKQLEKTWDQARERNRRAAKKLLAELEIATPEEAEHKSG